MSNETEVQNPARAGWRMVLDKIWEAVRLPFLALLTAFIIGGLLIWVTTGSLATVGEAYAGLVRGAFFKQRGFSESLIATIPYIMLGLAVAIGFKAGLFNIGVEGQYFIGAVTAAWAGQAITGLPAIIHLPLVLTLGALGGAVWAAIPGYLKARLGAHEVITTIMMNYIAFRLVEYLVSIPLRDFASGTVQTKSISPAAELWTFHAIPQRLTDPVNALMVGLVAWLLVSLLVRTIVRGRRFGGRLSLAKQRLVYLGAGGLVGLLVFLALPPLTRLWWPFTDRYDRLHTGLFIALLAAVFTWWLLWKTTIGFELRTVGANPNAARYAGINITRNIVLAMFVSGAMAGLAGTIEVIGLSTCRCLPLFFSSGYGFDSIAVALLAKNDPFGILAAAFLFGAMRNGADLMELQSGVSKYIISLIQALGLLFVAAPAIVRGIYRVRTIRRGKDTDEVEAHGWGG